MLSSSLQPAPVQRANQDENTATISIRMRRCRSDERSAKPDRSEEEGARGRLQDDGRECRPQGDPEEVRVHDFLIKKLGRAVPYGIYDLAANAGWVSVGIDHDTAAFPVQTIRSWWHSTERRGKSVQTAGASSVHSSGFTSRACDRSANHAPPRCSMCKICVGRSGMRLVNWPVNTG